MSKKTQTLFYVVIGIGALTAVGALVAGQDVASMQHRSQLFVAGVMIVALALTVRILLAVANKFPED